ncbi:MAG TPA: aldehyde dehydrogenase family protein [Candidatus Sulfotelmatobacter sp.]|jgi:acyl-CoA reductase-like NAD-dependent aldehyde dehydrogenase|nr:aldehyde dehydrogenase family protein [Candidatus Sulfotelmatobacter sp.]
MTVSTISNSELLHIIAPATRRELGVVPVASADLVSKTVANAVAAQPAWAARRTGERAEILQRAAVRTNEESANWSRLLAEESGKILAQAQFEINLAAAITRGNAEKLRSMGSTPLPTETLESTADDIAWVRRAPLGVVAAILPFNFPAELFAEKAAAALAMGNAVIVKPPEQDPLTVIAMREAFVSAGVPADVLAILPGGRQTGAALCADPRIAAVSLTGSTRAGIEVASMPLLRKLHLELGGNDAAIICHDADLELAAGELIFGRTLMNGQACASNKRIIVHRSIASGLVEKLSALLAPMRVGDPLDPATAIGPLISAAAAQRVGNQVARAVEQGARLVWGSATARDTFFSPCILADVPRSAEVANDDEIFGPVLTCIPFDTEEEAISIANQSSFGLSGCVFSRDWSRALKLSERLACGGAVVNGTGNYRPPFVPFGGVKQSGLGREGLGYTLEEMSQPRYTVLRRIRKSGGVAGIS